MSATVDLSREREYAAELVAQALRSGVGPALEQTARDTWPRDTGRSAEAWRFDGRALTNPTPYTEFVKHAGGLALDTVLEPALRAAVARTYTAP